MNRFSLFAIILIIGFAIADNSTEVTTNVDFTTSEITSGDITTSQTPITSGDITTAQVTSGQVTSGPLTSGQVTTSPATSGRVTTGIQITSGGLTSGAVPITSGAPPVTSGVSPVTSGAAPIATTGVLPYQRKGNVTVSSFNSTNLGFFRSIQIYTPKSYNPANTAVRYPVVYFLHGFVGNYLSFGYILDVVDQLIENGTLDEVILVKPDGSLPGSNPPVGSLWVDSTYNGKFESFFLQEVVPFIDSNFNTDPKPEKRFLMGHSFGASAALRIGFQNTNLFKAVASHSGFNQMDYWLASYYVNQSVFIEFNYTAISPTGPNKIFTLFLFTASKAWSPNANATYGVDLPMFNNGSGILRRDIVDKWSVYSPHLIATDNREVVLNGIDLLYLDIGRQDELLLFQPNLDFCALLLNLDIPYQLVIYDGPHNNPTLLYLRFTESLSQFGAYLRSQASPPTTNSPGIVEEPTNYRLIFGIIGGIVGFFLVAGLIVFIAVKSKWHVIFLEKELALPAEEEEL